MLSKCVLEINMKNSKEAKGRKSGNSRHKKYVELNRGQRTDLIPDNMIYDRTLHLWILC